MLFFTVFITIISTFIYVECKKPVGAPARLLVTRVGPCDEKAHDIIELSEMNVNRVLYDSSMSGKLNISKDVANGWRVMATMQKCHDIRNLDTCDFYRSIVLVEDGCEDSPQEDVYDMFFHYVAPELSCPLKAGSYQVVEYPFFTDDSDLVAVESKISTSLFGYTFRVEGFQGDERILCADAYIKQQYIRQHNWIGDVTLAPQVHGNSSTDDNTITTENSEIGEENGI